MSRGPLDRGCPRCGACPELASDLPLVACLACGWKRAGARDALREPYRTRALREIAAAIVEPVVRVLELLTETVAALPGETEAVDVERHALAYPWQDFRHAVKGEALERAFRARRGDRSPSAVRIVRAVVCHHCRAHLGIGRTVDDAPRGVTRWQLARFYKNHNPCAHAPKDAPEANRTSVSILVDTWLNLADRLFLTEDPGTYEPENEPSKTA